MISFRDDAIDGGVGSPRTTIGESHVINMVARGEKRGVALAVDDIKADAVVGIKSRVGGLGDGRDGGTYLYLLLIHHRGFGCGIFGYVTAST